MASPISPMEALEIVGKVVALYQKVKNDVPEQIKEVGRRMQRLEKYLSSLKSLLDNKSKHILGAMVPDATNELRTILSEIRDKSNDVYKILDQWRKNKALGLTWKFDAVAQALFAIGSSPDKLEKLSQDIEQLKTELRDFMDMNQYTALNFLMGHPTHPPSAAGAMALSVPEPIRSPSPRPRPSDFKASFIFVDPFNRGRSVVAEAYMHLLYQWTTRTGGPWPHFRPHSAGISVSSRSDCVDVLESAILNHKMSPGYCKPIPEAMASLFDNALYNYPYKARIKKEFEDHNSRGINHDIFRNYDYILIFAPPQLGPLLKLRKFLISTYGPSIAPEGKGRVVLLGSYLKTNNGVTKIILDASKDKYGNHDRGEWNKTTSLIKLAIKGFLTTELGWKQPDPRIPQR